MRIGSGGLRERRVAVVGGGVAGLVAGIYLLRAGVRCEIYEKNAAPGGNLCGWERDGYYIDNCLHWLCGTREGSSLHRLWEDCGALGGAVRLNRPRALYTSYGGGAGEMGAGRPAVSFLRDPDRTAEQMRKFCAGERDRAALDRLFRAVEAARLSSEGRLSPGLPIALAPYANRSIGSVAAGFESPLLRAALTDLFPGIYHALGFILTYAGFAAADADLPADGSRAMAERMAARFLSLGGILKTRAKVSEVLLSGEEARGLRYRTEEGEERCEEADRVILACDPSAIFGKLLPQDSMPRPLSGLCQRPESYPLWSAVQFAFAAPPGERLPFSGSVAFPIRPLAFGEKRLDRLMLRAQPFVPTGGGECPPVFDCLLPLYAREGREWIAARSRSPETYRRMKEELAAEVLARAAEFFSAPVGRARLLAAWTPATYRRLFGGEDGCFMSFALTEKNPLRTAALLAFGDSDRAATPRGVRNLRLAGQWMRLPGGLPSAAESGRAAARWALRSFRRAR